MPFRTVCRFGQQSHQVTCELFFTFLFFNEPPVAMLQFLKRIVHETNQISNQKPYNHKRFKLQTLQKWLGANRDRSYNFELLNRAARLWFLLIKFLCLGLTMELSNQSYLHVFKENHGLCSLSTSSVVGITTHSLSRLTYDAENSKLSKLQVCYRWGCHLQPHSWESRV